MAAETDNQARIVQLKAMLAGRTDSADQPKKGYKKNVIELRREIARLEAIVGVGG